MWIMPDPIDVADRSRLDVWHQLQSAGSICVLIGSGVSRFAPTGLPTGKQFTQGVVEALFPDFKLTLSSRDRQRLVTAMELLPLEVVMHRCPSERLAAEIVASLFASSRANCVHQGIAELVAADRVHSVVTTNYDLALDSALTTCGWPIPRVVEEGDVQSSQDGVYFKIHGCARSAASLVYSLRTETRLPRWKRDVLATCIADRPLVILGYSGHDFDVAPEIALHRPRSVIWNFYSLQDADRSPGLKHLVRGGVEVVPIIGHVADLMQRLGRRVGRLRDGDSRVDLGALLGSKLSDDELLLWRARLLNTMGHCRLAKQSIDRAARSSRIATAMDREEAQSHFQAGRYRSAARVYLRLAWDECEPDSRIELLLDACDALRCFGRWGRGTLTLALAEVLVRSRGLGSAALDARIRLKRLLLLKDLVGFLPAGSILRRASQGWAARLISEGFDAALESGEWLEFQQFARLSKKLSIPDGRAEATGRFSPLPPAEGYRQLGFAVGWLLDALDDNDGAAASYRELSRACREAADLGSYPTAWKFAARMAEAAPEHRRRAQVLHYGYLARCEYARWLRWRYKWLGYPL